MVLILVFDVIEFLKNLLELVGKCIFLFCIIGWLLVLIWYGIIFLEIFCCFVFGEFVFIRVFFDIFFVVVNLLNWDLFLRCCEVRDLSCILFCDFLIKLLFDFFGLFIILCLFCIFGELKCLKIVFCCLLLNFVVWWSFEDCVIIFFDICLLGMLVIWVLWGKCILVFEFVLKLCFFFDFFSVKL